MVSHIDDTIPTLMCIMGHNIEVPKVSHTIHLPTLFPTISVYTGNSYCKNFFLPPQNFYGLVSDSNHQISQSVSLFVHFSWCLKNYGNGKLLQELMSLTPAKQRAVNLVERLLSAQAELGRLKVTEEPTVHLSPEEARGAMLLKVLLLNLLIDTFPFLLGCLNP